jgi:hypothetical protein
LELPAGVQAWTWLTLTPQQAVVFGWEPLLDDPDAAAAKSLESDASEGEVGDAGLPVFCLGPAGGSKLHFPDGNETRLRYIVTAEGLRTEFRISSRWLLKDPADHIREGARKLAVHFMERPKAVLPFEEEVRKVMLGDQVAQSIRSQQSTADTSVAVLHANAAGQQGVYAGTMAG